MFTSVIGSYPTLLDSGKYARAYAQGDVIEASDELISYAVNAQVDAGIDVVSDGQTRTDFITLFARNFKGILIQSRPIVVDELEYKLPLTDADQAFVRKIIPEEKKIKGIVTGPYTLARYSSDRFYGSIEKLAFAYAKGLNQEVRALNPIVEFIQVDEPEFSIDYPEYAGDLINTVFEGVDKTRMLHSCGDVSDVFKDLVELNVDVLEHEFAANPHLLDTVKDIDFSQKLGYGCVRSDTLDVEPVSEVKDRIKNALKVFDKDRIMLNPDCGLRNLPPDIAYSKLGNMVQARDSYK